jgi:hypothetical protein
MVSAISLSDTLGLPFQSLNFGKCQIALTQELIALAEGNIALLKIRVALPQRIFSGDLQVP